MSENQSSTEPDVDVGQAIKDIFQQAQHQAETDGRTRYQYRWLYFDCGNDFDDQLNAYGRVGWDVVQIIPCPANDRFNTPTNRIGGYNVLMKCPYWIEQPNE